jgi:tetratricopeptide (TPR) repeat protein
MRKLLILALYFPFLVACNTNASADKTLELQQKLIALDKEMGGANVTNSAKAYEFIKVSESLAAEVEKTNPDQYVDLLLKAAGLAKTIDNPQKSIELYQKVVVGLPQHKKAPTALFMIGFVYENDLNNLEKAKQTYEQFLQQYPNDPDFADDAKTSLTMLGKTPEEIIREFEQKQQEE